MSLDRAELLQAIVIIANERCVRVQIKKYLTGSMVCAAMCFAGGLFFGPAGLLVGGATGGLAAYKITHGKQRLLSDVIRRNLSLVQCEEMVQNIVNAVTEVGVNNDLSSLVPRLMSSDSMQLKMLEAIAQYLNIEFGMSVNY